MTNYQVAVVGSFVQDQMMLLGSLPAAGETRIGLELKSGCGGKGFNQAVACARQGIQTVFIGAVGNDAAAGEMRDFAEKTGLAIAEEVIENVPSGLAQIQVSKSTSQNQIGVFLGANDYLSADHINKHAALISNARVLVTQLEANLNAAECALKHAKNSGVTIILNPAPINDACSLEILSLADILIPNESEFAYLYNKITSEKLAGKYWECSPDIFHGMCLKLDVPTVIVTLGSEGVFVSHNSQATGYNINNNNTSYQIKDHKSFYKVPALKVEAVDTTGAGDAFCGGFAAGYLKYPDNFLEAVRYASAVAAISVTRPGTAPAMPDKSDVEKLLFG